jgi:hypothetical protein
MTATRGGGIYRFSGTARLANRTKEFSVILKTKVAGSLDAAPDGPYYWKRDYHIYESGLVADLVCRLTIPRCFGAAERSQDEVWIWLEDVADEIGREWPLHRYGLAARHLGQFQGASLLGRPLPDYPWLSRQRWRQWASRLEDPLRGFADHADHPLVQRAWPGAHAARTSRLWSDRERYLDALDRLPQVFCHQDIFRRNLFARRRPDGTEETVAIDWEFAGLGAIGQDASQMAPLTYIWDGYGGSLAELDDLVFQEYLAGLRDAGWTGDPALPRLGFAIASALRGLSPATVELVTSEQWRRQVEEIVGCSAEDLLDRLAKMLEVTLDRADEARELLPLVGA